jgi:hypothetical protein
VIPRSDADRRIRDDDVGVRVATALCSGKLSAKDSVDPTLLVLVRPLLGRLCHDVGGIRACGCVRDLCIDADGGVLEPRWEDDLLRLSRFKGLKA